MDYGCLEIRVQDLIFEGVIDSGWGTTRAEDAQGTPIQSRLSPSMLVNEDHSLSVHEDCPEVPG